MITPCPEAAENLPCRVKKGRSVSIDFDFTPEFAMDTIHSQAYWAKGDVDLPLIGMENDGCKSTTCPVAERATQSYHWTFDVDKKFPTRQFNVKMKMKNQQEDFCCFIFSIRLTKWGWEIPVDVINYSYERINRILYTKIISNPRKARAFSFGMAWGECGNYGTSYFSIWISDRFIGKFSCGINNYYSEQSEMIGEQYNSFVNGDLNSVGGRKWEMTLME